MRVYKAHLSLPLLLGTTINLGMNYTPSTQTELATTHHQLTQTPLNTLTQPKETTSTTLLVEVRNVAFALQFPQLNYLFSLLSSPEGEIQSFFQELRDCPTDDQNPIPPTPSTTTATPPTPWPARTPPSTNSTPEQPFDLYDQLPTNAPDADDAPRPATTYPPLVQLWLTNRLSTQETQNKALEYFGGCRPTRYVKALIAFAPGIMAKALDAHTDTLELLTQCKASGTPIHLCADCNSAEWALFKEKHLALFGPNGIFDAAHIHISGDCGQLMSNPAFFERILTELRTQETSTHRVPEEAPLNGANATHLTVKIPNALFIGNNPTACAAAQQAHIPSVHYNCKNDVESRVLRHFLMQKNALHEHKK
ncbi:hypothetical protein [Methylicorpusculum sp.]|uniref:hypothetical protein n=1 Tax=Methylicorpusculum sp. TaxID=2713644 RepID=UPI002ABB4AE0|nr:hypothetical protein [Methylicorpusculum sp.]MDZ4153563.1 hypothetical protein [Methylicorpusculum sp.]